MPNMPTTSPERALDVADLRAKVQRMYEKVALAPDAGDFHFEIGRPLAERLGYPAAALDAVPAEAIESFAGVGYYFDLAGLRPGERVVDLGSGSGMDAFLAAAQVGRSGRVIGVDMTEAQLEKARRLARATGADHLELRRGLLEEIPLEDDSADCVISNGVINLCPDKIRVFAEIARVLRPGGRVALADIVTDVQLPADITCNATLWAACIGGAAQRDAYRATVEGAGLRVAVLRDNAEYLFLSRSAQSATRRYGVRSVSLLAIKEPRA
jgi:ubiquinone/menaquinone biosynthesis C-methylase UbiE